MARFFVVSFCASLLLASAIALPARDAAAVPITFDCAGPHSDPASCAAAKAPLSVTLDALGASQVRLTLDNAGPGTVVFTKVLFEGDVLGDIAHVGNDRPGVLFREIPSWVLALVSKLTPNFQPALGAVAAIPSWYRGVGAGEQLTLDLDIAQGFAFGDVLDALGDGSLRIAIGAVLPCDVEFLVSRPVHPPIPEPGTFALVGLGLAGLLRFGSPRT